MGVAKWLNGAPRDPPRPPEGVPIDLSSQKSIYRCIMTRQTKKSLGAIGKTQQEACYFAFSGHFGHIPHFFFDTLVPGFSSDQLQIEMSVIMTRWR